MDAPYYNGAPGDDDPDGTEYDYNDGRCPSCGALDDEDCAPDCGCKACLLKRQPVEELA